MLQARIQRESEQLQGAEHNLPHSNGFFLYGVARWLQHRQRVDKHVFVGGLDLRIRADSQQDTRQNKRYDTR